MSQIERGTWVEIEQIVLNPAERSPALPVETRQTPYVLRVSGFLLEDAAVGDEARISTLIGRELRGVLRTVNPGYTHSFGQTVRELLDIGLEEEQP